MNVNIIRTVKLGEKAAIVFWQFCQKVFTIVKKTVVAIIEGLLEVIAILMILAISFTGLIIHRFIPAVKQWILTIVQYIQFYFGAK